MGGGSAPWAMHEGATDVPMRGALCLSSCRWGWFVCSVTAAVRGCLDQHPGADDPRPPSQHEDASGGRCCAPNRSALRGALDCGGLATALPWRARSVRRCVAARTRATSAPHCRRFVRRAGRSARCLFRVSDGHHAQSGSELPRSKEPARPGLRANSMAARERRPHGGTAYSSDISPMISSTTPGKYSASTRASSRGSRISSCS